MKIATIDKEIRKMLDRLFSLIGYRKDIFFSEKIRKRKTSIENSIRILKRNISEEQKHRRFIDYKKSKYHKVFEIRRGKIKQYRKKGMTYRDIADMWNISTERVRQIENKNKLYNKLYNEPHISTPHSPNQKQTRSHY